MPLASPCDLPRLYAREGYQQLLLRLLLELPAAGRQVRRDRVGGRGEGAGAPGARFPVVDHGYRSTTAVARHTCSHCQVQPRASPESNLGASHGGITARRGPRIHEGKGVGARGPRREGMCGGAGRDAGNKGPGAPSPAQSQRTASAVEPLPACAPRLSLGFRTIFHSGARTLCLDVALNSTSFAPRPPPRCGTTCT